MSVLEWGWGRASLVTIPQLGPLLWEQPRDVSRKGPLSWDTLSLEVQALELAPGGEIPLCPLSSWAQMGGGSPRPAVGMKAEWWGAPAQAPAPLPALTAQGALSGT